MKTQKLSGQHDAGRGTRLVAFALVLAASPAASAQPSLAQAVEAAFERHPESRLADARRNLGRAQEARAKQPFAGHPAFNLKYLTDAVGSNDGYREWEGGVELPLWWPGQRSAQHQEAVRTLASANAVARAKRLEVAGEVRERLWELALARSKREDARLAYGSAKELEADIARRVEAGELPRSDLLLARRETLSREDALQQAENRARQAEQHFKNYTGLDEVPPAKAENPTGAARLPASHPDLVLAAADVDRARAHRNRVAAERGAGPNLWLGGKSTRDLSGADYDSSLGVEVTIPLASKAHSAPALAEAESALTEALARQERTRLELQDALAAATLERRRAGDALRAAVRRQALAEESLRLSRRAFELGETDLVRLLRARSDALVAHHDLQARRLEVGRATARLNQILGIIPQ
jgi:outer membrane protein TolC